MLTVELIAAGMGLGAGYLVMANDITPTYNNYFTLQRPVRMRSLVIFNLQPLVPSLNDKRESCEWRKDSRSP